MSRREERHRDDVDGEGQEALADRESATDERVNFDYVAGSVERPAPARELGERIDGDVRFDQYSRTLYATDASAYAVEPVGVVFPTSTADVVAVVEYCRAREMAVLPRGGGTSLAGQAVNEAVVLDFTRYMNDVVSIDPETKRASAQPGITLGSLNGALAEHDLTFAPDPAWGEKSSLGGAIGNNSSGSHSLQYGKTDAYVESCEVVLADGTKTTFGEISVKELRERAADPAGRSTAEGRIYRAVASILDEHEIIDAAYPDLKRNVSGYNLDCLVAEARTGSVNLAHLLAGSEGTLGIITEATVSLESIPETKSVALLRYETLDDAMRDVAPVVEHGPAAVEVLDDVLLDLARETEEFGELVDEIVPEGTGAVLLVEFFADAEMDGKQRVAALFEDRLSAGSPATPIPEDAVKTTAPINAVSASEAHDKGQRNRFWQLRKSGLPILLSRTDDSKHVSFIEDVAVPPRSLPAFVSDFQDILDDHDTFASFYGHAGPGCLHIRPLINLKTEEGVGRMESIADAVTDLVVEYEGSVSGEHGDGRARTQWNKKLYGEETWGLFRELKTAFDPAWVLNPGQVCGFDPDTPLPGEVPDRAVAVSMTENLRISPDYSCSLGFEPELRWDNDNGMQGMVELCHGCGGCRGEQETTGGVMCPTYRATREESTSTRGRANALRSALSGNLPADPTDPEFSTEVMDLCVGCKGCLRDCPSGVDMAKLKAEVQYQRHQQRRPSLRDRLFANVDRVSAIGSALAPLPSVLDRLPGSDLLGEKLFGIARERDLPPFRRETLVDWADGREISVSPDTAEHKVLLFPDTYTNYSQPAVGKAAIDVLEAANVHVQVVDAVTSSGRAAHSQGFLDLARERAATNVDVLAPRIADGWDVVVPEPSDAVMLQSDYHDLLDGRAVDAVASNTYGVCEYIDRHSLDDRLEFVAPDESLIYHGHCQQTAIKRDHHAVGVLRRAGYTVDVLDSGCCGMAGSFGYESEHYSLSQSIAAILHEQIEGSSGETVVTPGASCRTQLADSAAISDQITETATPPHPIQALANVLDVPVEND